MIAEEEREQQPRPCAWCGKRLRLQKLWCSFSCQIKWENTVNNHTKECTATREGRTEHGAWIRLCAKCTARWAQVVCWECQP